LDVDLAPPEVGLFVLPPRYQALQAEARQVAGAVADLTDEADRADRIHPGMRRALASSGLGRIMVAAEFGGRLTKVDALAVTVVREVFASVSAHLDSLFAMQGIGSYALWTGGAPELKRRWLPAVAGLDAIAALALTEPSVGSDLKAITTTACRDAGDLVLSGHKSFITNAGDADFYLVLAREDNGYSLVFVPADAAGLEVTHPHQIIAPHVLGDVVLTDVRVPASHRIGQPGDAFSLALATLATFRVSVAGAAVGLAEAALNEAVAHTTKRDQFGVPLSRLGRIPTDLGLSWTEIEMARWFTYAAAAAAARDPRSALHLSSMAKVGATEVAARVVDRCVQAMGRFGLIQGSTIERLYREARPMRIYEGSTEALLDALSRQLVKRRASA
jgi:acyl-CoA dehydrogenase